MQYKECQSCNEYINTIYYIRVLNKFLVINKSQTEEIIYIKKNIGQQLFLICECSFDTTTQLYIRETQ